MGAQAELSIDASVLVLPPKGCDKEDVYQYASALAELGQVVDLRWISVCTSKETPSILVNPYDRYPLTVENVKKLLEKHNVHEYNSQDIVLTANKILGKSDHFESCHGIDYMILSQEEMKPDITSIASNENHKSDLPQLIAAIAVLRKNLNYGDNDHIMMIRNTPFSSVNIQATIEEVDTERCDIPEFSDLPKSFSGDVPICSNFTEFVGLLDEEAILSGASDCCGIWLAIRVALHKRTGGKAHINDWKDWSDVPIAIGVEFPKSCQALIRSGDSTLPRKIIDAVISIIHGEDRETHAWNVSEGGGSKQARRGDSRQFRAWRGKIDGSRRIHYWKGPEGAIELAAVGEHDTTSFPDPSKLN